MQVRYPILGDVRGHGLFIGIELSHPGTCKPATEQAAYLVKRMLAHKILTSVDGPDNNVIKIKPPMCITEKEVSFFIEVLDKTLQEDFMQLV